MNEQAQEHCSKAAEYIAKGDEFYRKAKPEIEAAKKEGASVQEICSVLQKSERWVYDVLAWDGEGTLYGHDSKRRELDNAKRVLREAPLEQVESLIDALSDERKRAVAAAAGDAYLKARQDYDEEEQRKTPAQRKSEEAAASAITEAGKKAAGGFLSLGIAGHIEQATEELRELVADGSVTPQSLEFVTTALRALLQEYEVACAMVGLDSELEAVV